MSLANPSRLRWRDALSTKVREEVSAAVLSNYTLAVLLCELAWHGEYAGKPLELPAKPVDRTMFLAARRALVQRAILLEDPALPKTLLRVPGHKDTSPAELLCQADPFGHIAYLSAMAHHGLTNRSPRVLYFRTLDPKNWSAAARTRMEKDLGEHLNEYLAHDLPSLQHTRIDRYAGIVVQTQRSKTAGTGWRHMGDRGLRVSTLGRTFLDMLQQPDFCGGIRHVIELFEEHARTYLGVILPEITQHGSKIDQARAGYILEERCSITDPAIDAWAAGTMRGGSRRLDPQAEYSPIYSERWCLSLNV